MHILYVTHNLPWLENTGTGVVVDNYIRESLKKGNQVSLLIPEQSMVGIEFQSYASRIDVYGYRGQENWAINGFQECEFFDANEPLSIADKVDIVHVVTWVGFKPSLFFFLKKFGAPIVKHVCNFEEFCPFVYPVVYENAGQYCQSPIDKSTCIECVADNVYVKIDSATNSYKIWLDQLNNFRRGYVDQISNSLNCRKEFVEKIYNHFCDYVIFPSAGFRDYFSKQIVITCPSRVINHGIDVPKYTRNHISSPVKFVYVSGERRNKGFDIVRDAIIAMDKCVSKKLEFHLYGTYSPEVKERLMSLEVPVFFHESFMHSDLSCALKDYDVLIAPSRFESFGLLVREAVQLQIVPIVLDTIGISEFIINNENGIILSGDLGDSLVQTVRTLSDTPTYLEKLKFNISKHNQISVHEEFLLLYGVYESLIKP